MGAPGTACLWVVKGSVLLLVKVWAWPCCSQGCAWHRMPNWMGSGGRRAEGLLLLSSRHGTCAKSQVCVCVHVCVCARLSSLQACLTGSSCSQPPRALTLTMHCTPAPRSQDQPDVHARFAVAADGLKSPLRAAMLPRDPGPRLVMFEEIMRSCALEGGGGEAHGQCVWVGGAWVWESRLSGTTLHKKSRGSWLSLWEAV